MRLEFSATEGGFDAENLTYCLICGVHGLDAAGQQHYLNFQRGVEDEEPSEDWGVHCEFDDQINSGYSCVRRCRLTRGALAVELSYPIDRRKKYTEVSVDISGLDEATYAAMRLGLPRIFRGTIGVLEMS